MTDGLIPLQRITDARGSLVVLETGKAVPFPVKRTYFIYGTKDAAPRGFHAHKTLDQVFVCVQGSCDVLLDDGKVKKTVRLDKPDAAIHVGPMVWHEMHDFSADCIFLALASDRYDENDYIRKYEDFTALAAGK